MFLEMSMNLFILMFNAYYFNTIKFYINKVLWSEIFYIGFESQTFILLRQSILAVFFCKSFLLNSPNSKMPQQKKLFDHTLAETRKQLKIHDFIEKIFCCSFCRISSISSISN